MSLTDQARAAEKQRVQEVTEQIAVKITELEEQVGQVQSDVVEIRKHYWDEVTMDMSTSEDAVESIASMRQQSEVLSERERTHRQVTRTLGKLRKLVHFILAGSISLNVVNGK